MTLLKTNPLAATDPNTAGQIIVGSPAKASPTASDLVLISDQAASGNGKQVTLANLSILVKTGSTNTVAAGQIGEKLEVLQTNVTSFPATTVWGDLGSVTLTPGTWNISSILSCHLNGATQTVFSTAISTNSGTNNGAVYGLNLADGLPATSVVDNTIGIPQYILMVSSNTSVYCKVYSTHSAGTPQYRGRLTAIRIG